MKRIIRLSFVAWWAVGLILAAEPVAPSGTLAAWDKCRDEALVAHHQQTLAIIKRCFPGDNFVSTEEEVRALPEPDALIIDRYGPEPLTASGALQARSCDTLYPVICLSPNAAFLAAKVATLDPRAIGEPQVQELDALRVGGCGELTREAFGRLFSREPQRLPLSPSCPAPPRGQGC